jgi:hypothetical protein
VGLGVFNPNATALDIVSCGGAVAADANVADSRRWISATPASTINPMTMLLFFIKSLLRPLYFLLQEFRGCGSSYATGGKIADDGLYDY